MSRSKKVLSFWSDLAPVMTSMHLDEQGHEIDQVERPEILGYLPDLAGKRVLELAAGIGRFTESFAQMAHEVVAVDITPHFVERNKQNNARFNNIEYVCADAMTLDYPPASFDLIFINWMMMYLENDDLPALAVKLESWLKPGGHLFFRESCATEYVHLEEVYYVHYRPPEHYTKLFDDRLVRQRHGSVQTYEALSDATNQCFWLYTKK